MTAVAAGLMLLVLVPGLPLWAFSALAAVVYAVLVPLAAISMTLLYGDAVAEHEGLSPRRPRASRRTTGRSPGARSRPRPLARDRRARSARAASSGRRRGGTRASARVARRPRPDVGSSLTPSIVPSTSRIAFNDCMNATRPSLVDDPVAPAFGGQHRLDAFDRLQLRLHQLVAHQPLVLGSSASSSSGWATGKRRTTQQPLGAVGRRVGEQLAELVEQPRHEHRLVLAELDQEPVARLAHG